MLGLSLDIEAQYLKTVSGWRRPVLTAIMSFDVFCFFVRITWQVGDYLFFDGEIQNFPGYNIASWCTWCRINIFMLFQIVANELL